MGRQRREEIIEKRRVGQRGPTLPYRLLALLLYGRVPGIKRMGHGRVLVETTQLADYLKTSNDRLRNYTEKLADWGVIEDVEMYTGTMIVYLAMPHGMGDERD
jgi:hypothetical protein